MAALERKQYVGFNSESFVIIKRYAGKQCTLYMLFKIFSFGCSAHFYCFIKKVLESCVFIALMPVIVHTVKLSWIPD